MHLMQRAEIPSAIKKDDATMADTMTRAEFIEYMKAFEKRLDGRFESLEGSMKIQFEDVRKDIRLSFEAVVALRETTERGFAGMRVDHKQQIGLLETAIKHVRGRVDRRERTKRRRD